MVYQVLADFREIHDGSNTDGVELIGRPNSRQHEYMRCSNSPSREYDFLLGLEKEPWS